jgi:hypothetical protein
MAQCLGHCAAGPPVPSIVDFAATGLPVPGPSQPVPGLARQGWVHARLVRRHLVGTEGLAYYLVYAPVGWPVQEVVWAAGARWTIEEMFKLAKGHEGLDHYEVRSWQGWYRHIALALVALAALAVGSAKGGTALPRAHPPHCPGNPWAFGPPPVGHKTDARINRGLVPLEASASEDGPSMPPPSPLETLRGTVILSG